MSKPLLFIAFYLVIAPVGLTLRRFGYDPMALKKWKNGHSSVFVERNHSYTAKDLSSPR